MHVELTENDAGVLLSLTEHEAGRLRLASARWRKALRLPGMPLSVEQHEPGRFLVYASGVAGFVKIGNLSIDIAPKFLDRVSAGDDWRTAMWRFLAYGEGQELLNEHAVGCVTKGIGIADVLADSFFRSASLGHVMGYPMGYRQKHEQSDFMKGKLDNSQLMRLVPFTGSIPVVSSRLSRDVALNRLMKWAALKLASLVEKPSRRKRLMGWASDLAEVSSLPPDPTLVTNYKQQYPHLVPAIDIALILQADLLGTYGVDSTPVPGFLWNSDDLFERAMRRLFADAARPLGLEVKKRPHRLLRKFLAYGAKYASTYPDIDIFDAGGSQLILDAKYKVFSDYPSSDDTYQVMAAGRVACVSDVALVYPTSSMGFSTTVFEPFGLGLPRRVTVIQIGLESFKDRGSVRRIQEEIQVWLTGGLRSSRTMALGIDGSSTTT